MIHDVILRHLQEHPRGATARELADVVYKGAKRPKRAKAIMHENVGILRDGGNDIRREGWPYRYTLAGPAIPVRYRRAESPILEILRKHPEGVTHEHLIKVLYNGVPKDRQLVRTRISRLRGHGNIITWRDGRYTWRGHTSATPRQSGRTSCG